jgi:hypothetical protein
MHQTNLTAKYKFGDCINFEKIILICIPILLIKKCAILVIFVKLITNQNEGCKQATILYARLFCEKCGKFANLRTSVIEKLDKIFSLNNLVCEECH